MNRESVRFVSTRQELTIPQDIEDWIKEWRGREAAEEGGRGGGVGGVLHRLQGEGEEAEEWRPAKGEFVMRKGQRVKVVVIDRGTIPWAYTVAYPDGREVGTELDRLTRTEQDAEGGDVTIVGRTYKEGKEGLLQVKGSAGGGGSGGGGGGGRGAGGGEGFAVLNRGTARTNTSMKEYALHLRTIVWYEVMAVTATGDDAVGCTGEVWV